LWQFVDWINFARNFQALKTGFQHRKLTSNLEKPKGKKKNSKKLGCFGELFELRNTSKMGLRQLGAADGPSLSYRLGSPVRAVTSKLYYVANLTIFFAA